MDIEKAARSLYTPLWRLEALLAELSELFLTFVSSGHLSCDFELAYNQRRVLSDFQRMSVSCGSDLPFVAIMSLYHALPMNSERVKGWDRRFEWDS